MPALPLQAQPASAAPRRARLSSPHTRPRPRPTPATSTTQTVVTTASAEPATGGASTPGPTSISPAPSPAEVLSPSEGGPGGDGSVLDADSIIGVRVVPGEPGGDEVTGRPKPEYLVKWKVRGGRGERIGASGRAEGRRTTRPAPSPLFSISQPYPSCPPLFVRRPSPSLRTRPSPQPGSPPPTWPTTCCAIMRTGGGGRPARATRAPSAPCWRAGPASSPTSSTRPAAPPCTTRLGRAVRRWWNCCAGRGRPWT